MDTAGMGREEWVKVLRDELRFTRENTLCTHGVPPANCEHHKTIEETP